MYCSVPPSIVKYVASNTNSNNTMINDNEGIEVCLGGDINGCGNVLCMNRFTQPYKGTYDEVTKEFFLYNLNLLINTKTCSKNSNI